MNTATAIGMYAFGFLVVVGIGIIIRRMLRGWRQRSELQEDLVATLPMMPDLLSPAVIPPTRGLYVGSTLAPNWLERITAGDLGFRCNAVLTERALAGKVLPTGRGGTEAPRGILVIRWRLPSGAEIDTGFRGEDRRAYVQWTTGDSA